MQWVFPIIYGINAITYGFIGSITGGTRVLQQALPGLGANALCAVIGLGAAIAFVGIVFGGEQRTDPGQQAERLGAIVLTIGSVAYVVILVIALGAGTTAPVATIVSTATFVVLAVFRISDLSAEIGKRRRPRTEA